MTAKSKKERLWEWLKKQDYGLVDTRKIYDYVTKYYK